MKEKKLPVELSSITAVTCKYQAAGYCGFFSSVSREETPEQTIPDVQLGHLASTLHCLTWNLVSVQSQGNTGIKPIVICTVPEQKEQLIRLYCM